LPSPATAGGGARRATTVMGGDSGGIGDARMLPFEAGVVAGCRNKMVPEGRRPGTAMVGLAARAVPGDTLSLVNGRRSRSSRWKAIFNAGDRSRPRRAARRLRYRGSCSNAANEGGVWNIVRRRHRGTPSDRSSSEAGKARGNVHCAAHLCGGAIGRLSFSGSRVGSFGPRSSPDRGRRHGTRQTGEGSGHWQSGQIARRLRFDFPDDETSVSATKLLSAMLVQARGGSA